MKYNTYKSDVDVIINDLEALEGVFVFPSQGYKLSKGDTHTFSIECIFIDYNINNDKPFKLSFLKHITRLDERTFYAILETDELNKEKDKISSGTYMVNVINGLKFVPFFITNKNILVCGGAGDHFDDYRYRNIDRFVGNGQFNYFLVLLADVKYKHMVEIEYQIEKFENAIIALQWIISHGFPYNKIIDWDKNKIIDVDLKNALMTNDVPFNTDFIVGNPEKRFCRLIRFGLKIFLMSKRDLIEKLINLNVIDPTSSMLFLEIIKEPIVDVYVPEVQSSSTELMQPINTDQKKPDVFVPAFTITMRISQPQGFTEILLEESQKHPKILGGIRWELKPVKTINERRQRYHINFYPGERVNISQLSKKLEEIRKFCIRLLANSGLDNHKLKPSNVKIWLYYLEITIPNINREITKACRDMFTKELGKELAFSRKFEKLSNPEDDKILFRFGFGFLSSLAIDWYTEKQNSSNRLDRCDPFTKAAINHALSGNYTKARKLLDEVYELFSTDRSSDMPKQFHDYIENNEKELIPYITKSHPMSFMSNDHYVQLKKDVEFFIAKYYLFEDIGKLIETAIESQKIELIAPIRKKLTQLGVYEEKDLSYLDDVCHSISLFFGAQYRKSLQS